MASMLAKRITLVLAAIALLAPPAAANAQTHHRRHHHAHRRAHKTRGQALEYFPALEEWLTPEEARPVREFEAELPGLVAEVEAELAAEV